LALYLTCLMEAITVGKNINTKICQELLDCCVLGGSM
jgi:hypothetical protein